MSVLMSLTPGYGEATLLEELDAVLVGAVAAVTRVRLAAH